MKTLFLFCIALASSLLVSCIKESNGNTYNLSGRIFQSCTPTPLANREISFFQSISSNGVQTSGGDLGSTVTDANGNFSFNYKSKNNSDIKIQLPAGFGFNSIMAGIPANKNLENIVIRYGPKTTIQVRLNVSKPYTSNDTLQITDFSNLNQKLKITGPFVGGVVYNAMEFSFSDLKYETGHNTIDIGYKINNEAWKTKTFILIPCDTSRVIVDIN